MKKGIEREIEGGVASLGPVFVFEEMLGCRGPDLLFT